VSQGIEGNSRICLGNEGFPVLPRQLREFQAIGEILEFFYKHSILGNCTTTKKINFKN